MGLEYSWVEKWRKKQRQRVAKLLMNFMLTSGYFKSNFGL